MRMFVQWGYAAVCLQSMPVCQEGSNGKNSWLHATDKNVQTTAAEVYELPLWLNQTIRESLFRNNPFFLKKKQPL